MTGKLNLLQAKNRTSESVFSQPVGFVRPPG